jgi:hypothetical protein
LIDDSIDNKREEPKDSIALGKPFDSQDESIWTDLDIDLFSNMEANSNKQNGENLKLHSGFQTASGKSIPPPSKEARQKAIDALKDIEQDIASSTVLKGFTTASGKELAPPSEQARLKALAVLKGDNEEEEKNQPVMKGFETASGKPLQPISEKAKERANALFKQLEQEELTAPVSGFKTASGKNLADPSKESIQLAAALLKETDEQNVGDKRPSDEPLNADYKYENVLNQYGGFQMAHSRKGIQVSASAKRQAIFILEERKVPDIPITEQVNVQSLFKANQSSSYPTVPDVNQDSNTKVEPANTATTTVTTTAAANFPKRNKRVFAAQKGNRPFKSPIIKSNLELTKAAVKNKNVNKAKGTSVFDLTSSKFLI